MALRAVRSSASTSTGRGSGSTRNTNEPALPGFDQAVGDQ
jgi:hypothetical protein